VAKVSPREIDEALLDHSAIAQVVTFAVPHRSLGKTSLRPSCCARANHLLNNRFASSPSSRLAEFKVPSRVLFVESIPKGPSGKLQRIGLHQHLAHLLKPVYAAPETGVEEILSEIWAEVLDVERIGRSDNFFASGGDSLLAARVVARVRASLEVELSLETLFRFPTVAELGIVVEDRILNEADRPLDHKS
jgi:acyl carrier protein